nr:transposase [Escherichia coli]
MQKNVTPGRRKGCPNYPPEFKQLLVAASCEPGISISKLALENGINANLLFKWRQQWREGKLLLPSSESPQLLPVTLDAAAEQPESLAEDPETLSISCEVTFSSLLPPVNPGYPSQNLLLKMALTPICCSNGDNNGARESCYYLLQRAPSYFL